MDRRSLPRTVLVALTLLAVASCSKDDPEPVATGSGGLELSATTTEQPDVPESTTTSSTTTTTEPPETTTTSTTTTTTTAPAPVVPTAEEIEAALPGAEPLGAGEWSRTTAPTGAAAAPAPVCDGSAVASPLAPIVYEGAAAGGALARYERPDQSTRVMLVVAPLADAEAQLAVAQAAVDECTGSASPVNRLGWDTIGDASVAYSRTEETATNGQTAAWALARVGTLVVALNAQSFWADGQELTPAPTETELQQFLAAAVAAVSPLATRPPA
jgi:hypothetical protein